MNNKRVLMLHQFHQPHPAHRVFGDAIGADYKHFETGNSIGGPESNLNSIVARLQNAVSLNDYDVVIGEGTTPIYTLLFYKVLNNWSADVIPLIADETFLRISEQQTRHLWRNGIGQLMSKSMSGAVAVSQLCEEWARPYLKTEYRIVHPCIDDEKHRLLSDVSPSYTLNKSPRILHAGTVSDRAAVEKKNVNQLSEVVSNSNEWQLRLLGRGHDQFEYSTLSGVQALGYLEDLSSFATEFEEADVYVQPSVGDAFPVASLEAMLAGIPTVVSEMTGTKEVVAEVDPNLVCKPNAMGIKSGIEYVLSLSDIKRKQIGEGLSSRVRKLTQRNQSRRFRNAVQELIK